MTSLERIVLVDCGSDKTEDIAAILAGCVRSVEAVPLRHANRHGVNTADAVVISGGPLLFTDREVAPGLNAMFAFLTELKAPCLGICLGHQAIGTHYGARVYLGEARRSEERIRIECDHPLFKGFPDTVTLREDHCEGIDLPAGFRLLASSEAYPVEAMADDGRGLYGVQFHPEVSGELGRRLLKNFVGRLCSP